MNIIGLSGLLIDGASALIQDGKITAAVEEERIARIKHMSMAQSGGLPYGSLASCLNLGNISFEDIDHVGYFFEPWREFFSLSAFRLTRSLPSLTTIAYYQTYYLDTLRRHLAAEKHIRTLCGNKMKFHWLRHHFCHASSVYYSSLFEKSAILIIDAIGELECTSFYEACGNKITKIKKFNFPHSLGFIYATLTDYLGFRSNNDEYKVMGLASFGRPSYYEKLKDVIRIRENGSIEINYSYFHRYFRGREYVNQKFIHTFGPKRLVGEKISQVHMDIAASLQKILEESVLKMLVYLHKMTNTDNLCIAGGVALNSKMNGRILKESPFKNIFIGPAPHDAGCALGAALLVKHNILNQNNREPLVSPYLGDSYTDKEIKEILERAKIKYEYYEDIISKTAKLLADGKLVAWFQGRAEWGPRALGARSILADPTIPEMKDILNIQVKHREEFRPFAPSVTYDDAPKYFNLDRESPYMLFVVPVREAAKSKIPATVHVDGTARVHTVKRDVNPIYYDLLKKFEAIKGVPILLNTSLNINKEPIVNSPFDALRCFFSTGLDYLVMGKYLICK